jgi:hypothetical protein
MNVKRMDHTHAAKADNGDLQRSRHKVLCQELQPGIEAVQCIPKAKLPAGHA